MASVIAFFLLNGLTLLGDSIFVYFVSMKLLQGENGGLLSSLVLGMEGFFEIAIGPLVARFIDSIHEVHMRLTYSVFVQILLVVLAFLPAGIFFFQSNSTIGLILSIGAIRFCVLIGQQLQAVLPLYFEKQGCLPLLKTLSLTTFAQRSIPLLSSSLAPFLIGISWFAACSISSLTYLPAIVGLFLILKIAKMHHLNGENKETDSENGQLPHQDKTRKEWGNWYCLYLLLSSLSLGSIVLILTKSMIMTHRGHWMQMIAGPAPIYAGMVISLATMMAFPLRGDILLRSVARICLLTIAISAGLLCASFVNDSLKPFLLFITGILNGFSVISSSFFAQHKLEGKNFVRLIAKSGAFRKVGVIISLIAAGAAIDFGLSCNQLLFGYGLMGLIFSLFLCFRALSLERAQALESETFKN